jgi:hypothetical protein
MQECTFTDVSATRPLGSSQDARFYSDRNESVGNNAGGAADPPNAIQLSLSKGLVPAPLGQWDEWFLDTVEVCVRAPILPSVQ